MTEVSFGGPYAGTICLTFDFDTMAVWMDDSGAFTRGVLSRGDFGVRYERKLWMRDLVMGVAHPPVNH